MVWNYLNYFEDVYYDELQASICLKVKNVLL